MRALLPILLLAACGGGSAPPPTGPSSSPTSAALATDTPLTVTEATEGGCTLAMRPTDPALLALFPGTEPGSVLASGIRGVHQRAVDGTWTMRPGTAETAWAARVVALDDGTLWVHDAAGLQRLDPATATWLDSDFPGEAFRIEALLPDGAGGVAALEVSRDSISDVGIVGTQITVWHHDGTAWAAGAVHQGDYLTHPTLLPDGRLLAIEGYDDVVVVADGPDLVPVPLPAATVPTDLDVAPDGTVLVGGDVPALGPIDALVALPALPGGAHIAHLSVASGDDAWWLATAYGPEGLQHTLHHHDGATTVEVPLPGGIAEDWVYAMQADGVGGVVLSSGDDATRTVVAGTPAGLTVEREDLTVARLEAVLVDDTDGTFHAFGPDRRATWDGTAWVPDDRGLGLEHVSDGAVSGGRTLLASYEGLAVDDASGLVVTPFPDHSFYAFAGAEGTLFAAGVSQPYEQSADGPAAFVERGDGQGWQSLDLAALPASASVHALWADGPDDLWMSVSIGGQGALVHHDGTAATVVSTDLTDAAAWMARLSDGALWIAAPAQGSTSGLARYDGTTLGAVDLPDERDVTSVWRDDDGGLFAATVQRPPDPDEPGDTLYVPGLEHLAPGASAWSTVLVDSGFLGTPLTGYDSEVLAGLDGGYISLRRTCP